MSRETQSEKGPLGQLQKKGSEADRTAASRQTHGRDGSWESLGNRPNAGEGWRALLGRLGSS